MKRLVLLALALAVFAPLPASGATLGEVRVLVILATWGPTPFTQEDAHRVLAETDAFFRESSGGRASLRTAVSGWHTLPRARFDDCSADFLTSAFRTLGGGPATDAFDRLVYVTPLVPACAFHGEADPTAVLLNGRLTRPLAAHELGHTFGLGHASRWDCTPSCDVEEYGNGFSTMGGGAGDFNAFEKASLGWLGGVTRPATGGVHEIASIERAVAAPQALVVTTARSEFWFESRGVTTPSYLGDSTQPPGVLVLAGPSVDGPESPYPRTNLLLPNPSGSRRFAYRPGEAFVDRGVFRVTVERHDASGAALRFEWLDRVRPTRPVVTSARVRGRVVTLEWLAANDGRSGVASYTVIADGRVRAQLERRAWTTRLSLAPGTHRVSVVATDRAGNRSAAGTRRVVVRG